MKTEQKTIEEYLELPYTVTLRRDEEGDWVARVQELEGCTAHGATKAEALENLEEAQRAWIEDAIEAGDGVPEPLEEMPLPSGKWLQRVPRSLHKKLAEFARRENVSLNQLVTSILAEAVGGRGLSHADAAKAIFGSLAETAAKDVDVGSLSSRHKAWAVAVQALRRNLLEVWQQRSDSLLEAEWRIDQPSPPKDLYLFTNLVTTASQLSNRIETKLKVAEREKKEEHGHKSYTVGI